MYYIMILCIMLVNRIVSRTKQHANNYIQIFSNTQFPIQMFNTDLQLQDAGILPNSTHNELI